MNLTGKTAIITGGASGIGLAIAKRFSELGADLCLCDVSQAALDDVHNLLPGAILVRADVSRPDDVAQAFEDFGAAFDRLDVLVNNAGVSGPTKAFDEIADSEWADVMGVNISGMFHMARAAAPYFRKQNSGAVINMSSTAGRMGMPLRLPYSVTKHAVRGLTETLAMELGEVGVRVNSILPGFVNGPRGLRVISEQALAKGMEPEAYMQKFLHNISMHSMVEMEEIADMAAFLASDRARHVSGQSIGVCGNFESYRSPAT